MGKVQVHLRLMIGSMILAFFLLIGRSNGFDVHIRSGSLPVVSYKSPTYTCLKRGRLLRLSGRGKRSALDELKTQTTPSAFGSMPPNQPVQKMKITKIKRKYTDTGAPIKTAPKDMMDKFININTEFRGLAILNYEPPVFRIDNFFSEEECDQYIAKAEKKGTQVQSQTFSAATAAARTSTTWYMHYKDVPQLLVKAEQLTGQPLANFEEPQIVRYQMGQQFSWHYDAVPKSLLENGGQRVGTLLVYLNDVSQGGETAFRDLGLKVKPKKGSALLFFPAQADGTPDERTLHAGTMAMDDKWIAQMWLHQSEYKPYLPDNNSKAEASEPMRQYIESSSPSN